MKVGLYAAIVGFLLGVALIIGCGGGGGGGGTGGPGGGSGGGLGTDAPLAGQYIEFVDGGGNIVDPLCLRPGDVIQLQAVNYDPAGNRTVLATGSWTSAGGGGGTFSLTSAGVLTINSNTGFFQIRVTATVGGGTVNLVQDARGTTETTTISGRVTDAFSGTGIKYIQIEFYAGGARVGATLTGDNGNFTACVPTTVTGVSAKGATIPASTYYRQLRYNGSDYTVDGSTCAIPFTVSNAGGNNAMPFNIRLIPVSSGPPPPPGGCL